MLPAVLVQAERPKLVLEMARLLLAEVPKLALVLESQEPEQEQPPGQACTEMPIS